MIHELRPATPEAALIHYGAKGMHWGIRKDDSGSKPSLNVSTPGVTMRKDGSIDVKTGANLQRLARSNGKSLPMKDITFASLNDYDNARYIKIIGGKGIFGGGRDQVLSIKATAPIKAPSFDQSTRMVSALMIKDPVFRGSVKNALGFEIAPKELASIKSNPGGKTAQDWYFTANQSLTFANDPSSPYIQKTIQGAIAKKGFNALRDENDFQSNLSKAPIIIFSPEKNLKVVSVTNITDELRTANKAKLKQYKQAGKNWLEKETFE